MITQEELSDLLEALKAATEYATRERHEYLMKKYGMWGYEDALQMIQEEDEDEEGKKLLDGLFGDEMPKEKQKEIQMQVNRHQRELAAREKLLEQREERMENDQAIMQDLMEDPNMAEFFPMEDDDYYNYD